MLKALIFDFDGVIGNTYDLNFRISKEFDSKISEQDFQDHHNGNVFKEPKIHFKSDDIPIFFQKQRELFKETNLFPVADILLGLCQKYKLFIVSSTSDENIIEFLRIGGLLGSFTQILGATTHTSKVEKFKIILQKYNLNINECAFVTDTIGDIKEANQLNLRTIGVTWGYHPKELLDKEKPFAIANNIEELSHIIGIIA